MARRSTTAPAAATAAAFAPGLLGGVTVLDLSSVGPASRCTRLLADYGASVVKVAPVPGRVPAAVVPPLHAYGGHRHMRRVHLDLSDPGGRGAFLALAAGADVVVESFRPGVADRLGIGYATLRARHPGIVYCATSGYGRSGPHASWAGHDLDYLAVGGFLASCEPRADGGPPLPGATLADAAAGGMHAALAVVGALLRRQRTGEGAMLDVSVADGVLWLMSLAVDEHLATGDEPGHGHDVLTGRYACYGVYGTKDGRWLAVAAIEAKFFANLCRALNCERWISAQYDDDAQASIRAELTAIFARRTRDEWVAVLAGADTCVAPVLTVAEVGADAQYASRQAFTEARAASGERVRQVGAVLAGMVAPREPVELPDPAASNTDELLAEAGIDASEVARWRAQGVVA